MKVVILDRASVGLDISMERFGDFGEVCVYDSTPAECLQERIANADVIILNKIKIGKHEIDNAPHLKLICVTATGFDNIDIEAASNAGVAVCNVPGYSTDSVVLYTIATALSLFSKLPTYSDFVESGKYSSSGLPNRLSPVYHEISGKTWGIIGYGNIGRAVARVAEALGAKVIVYKRSWTNDAPCVQIETLLSESDIITVHCPLNDESRHLINDKAIQLMKPDVIIVNEARGAVVDSRAIRDAIINNRIGGFGADVYEQEPLPKNDPLFEIMHLPNVILTPHCAWGAYESRERCISIVYSNIKSFLDGKMQNRVFI